jgi:hypothetical protein
MQESEATVERCLRFRKGGCAGASTGVSAGMPRNCDSLWLRSTQFDMEGYKP